MVSLPDILLPKVRHFGLSIERTAVHALELSSSQVPVKMAVVPVPADTFSSGGLSKPEILAGCIKQVISVSGIRNAYVSVTFPEIFAYSRAVTLPNLDPEEMHEAIIWRIKELFPLPEQEIYFDWKILNRTETETEVSVVAVQRQVLDPLVQVLTKTGLKPLRFEPDASALARLVVIPKGRYAIVTEINPNGTYMTLVAGDKAIFTTVVNHAADDTPENYLNSINQGLREISGYFSKKGLLTNDNVSVVVTGEMGTAEWAAHISRLLGYPASQLTARIQQTAYFKAYAAAQFPIKPPDDIYSINVLSKDLQALYERDRNDKLRRVILGRSTLIFGVLTAISAIATGAVFLEKYRLDGQIRLEKQVGAGTGLTAQKIISVNTLARTIVALEPLRRAPVEPLTVFQSALTDAISISQWEYDDARLQFHVTGTAATREDLLAFKSRLEAEKTFSKITLPLGSLETPVAVPFTISFQLSK